MSVSDYSKKKSAPETALQRYYRLKNERQYKTDMTQQQTVQPVRETPAEEQNKGGFLGGIGYGLEKLGLGIVRGLEGVADYIVAGGADLFGQDEYAEKVMTDDWMNYNHADERYNPSEGWQTVGDITGSIGQMLPSVAAAAIPYVGPALSTGMFMTSAAGNAVSEAAKESGELGGKEWLYGSLSGAAEGAVEKVSGGIGGSKLGQVLGKQLGKTTLGKLGVTFAGEGLEEVASDLIDPALRRVTGVDKDATVDWEQLPKTFLVGDAAGSVMGAGTRAVDCVYTVKTDDLIIVDRDGNTAADDVWHFGTADAVTLGERFGTALAVAAGKDTTTSLGSFSSGELPQCEHGTLSYTVSPDQSTVTLTATPDSGYKLSRFSVDGTSVIREMTDNAYTTTWRKNLQVSATFSALPVVKYTFTVRADEEKGSVTLSSASVSEGSALYVTVSPKDGYETESVMFGDTALGYDEESGKYVLENVSASGEIAVTFKEKTDDPHKGGCGSVIGTSMAMTALLLLGVASVVLRICQKVPREQ